MAGARKHMERSHRSKGEQNYSVFHDFERRAMTISNQVNQRSVIANMFDGLKGLLHRNQGK